MPRATGGPAFRALASNFGMARHKPPNVVTEGSSVGDDAAGLGVDAQAAIGAAAGFIALLDASDIDVTTARGASVVEDLQ